MSQSEQLQLSNTNSSQKVALLWYPRGSWGFSHVKLLVGEQVYTTLGGYVHKCSAQELHDKAGTPGHKGYYQFNIMLQASEIERLREKLEIASKNCNGKEYPWCIKGICNAINHATEEKGFKIPKFFTFIPLITMIYLRCRAFFDQRITVEYIGTNQAKDILTPKLLGEAFVGIPACAFSAATMD